MHRHLCAALLGLAIALPAAAQMDDPLVSDRPDFTESTGTIAPGHVQVEGGITRQEIGEEETRKLMASARGNLGLIDGTRYLDHSRRVFVVARKRAAPVGTGA